MKKLLWIAVGVSIAAVGCADVSNDDERALSQGLEGTYVAGNPTCADLGLGEFEFKVESETDSGVDFDGYNSVQFSYVDTATGQVVEFTSDLAFDAVIVKGGPNALYYQFDPEATSATGLSAPINPNTDRYYDISHVSFCFDYELTVEKTAQTSFTRTWDWDIVKTATPDYHLIANGDFATTTYDVTVVQNGYTDSDWAIAGTITISNSTPFATTVETVDDVLSNGTAVPVDCGTAIPAKLLPGETLDCTYDIAVSDGSNLVNNVDVTTPTTDVVDGNSASAAADFDAAVITAVNETVTIEDNFEGAVTLLGNASATYTFTYSRDFTCKDEGVSNNTAEIVETGANDSASVRVVCATSENQGCTPGYWKNHLSAWKGYSPGDRVVNVFADAAPFVHAQDSLEDALDYRGGRRLSDAAKTLLRAATAALLDASHPGVDYPISVQEVIDRTNYALQSGSREQILAEKDLLDQYNNLGCPL